MSLNLWNCKRIDRRISKYEGTIDKFNRHIESIQRWITRDREELKEQLKKLSKEEGLVFGRDMGYIEEADYRKIKAEMEEQENE